MDIENLFSSFVFNNQMIFNYEYNSAVISAQCLEITTLNKLAIADAFWARLPVDGLIMTLV